jgi:hypothetical protein
LLGASPRFSTACFGTDLSLDPETGMVAIFMVQCSGGDQWPARDLLLKTATRSFQNEPAREAVRVLARLQLNRLTRSHRRRRFFDLAARLAAGSGLNESSAATVG